MARKGSTDSTSLGARILNTVRTDIISGRWRPGVKLQPSELSEMYATSITVIREALTRLAGEQFIDIEHNRGFFLPRLSLDQFHDITALRCLNESFAIRLAIERGDLDWEAALISVHHRLSRSPRYVAGEPGHTSEEWSLMHRQFHQALIAACGVPALLQLISHLSDLTEVYRRWAAPLKESVKRDAAAEHREILAAVLDRNADRAAALLTAHYEKTYDIIHRAGLIEEVTVTTGSGRRPKRPDGGGHDSTQKNII
jgi:DNA-binding GntR family transcriptional regulator